MVIDVEIIKVINFKTPHVTRYYYNTMLTVSDYAYELPSVLAYVLVVIVTDLM